MQYIELHHVHHLRVNWTSVESCPACCHAKLSE